MTKPRETIKADLLRGMVYCGYCNKAFSAGITSKKLKSETRLYYYFRCDTEGCIFNGKSVRAKVVIDYVTDFLSEHLFTTEANYEHYVKEATEYASVQAKALSSDIASLTKLVANKEAEYERTKATIRDNPQLARHYNLDEVDSELKSLQSDLTKLFNKRKRLKQAILTYKQYLELFESIGVNLRQNHDMGLLDEIVRKFYLNFTIKDRSVSVASLHEPWNEFVSTHNFVRGRGDRT